MSALFRQLYSNKFSETDTDTFGLASVQANAGDTILFTLHYRDDPSHTNVSSLPTWNSQTFVSQGARASAFFWTQTFSLVASGTATANIICPVDAGAFVLGMSFARVYSGVTSIETLQQESKTAISGYTNPSLIGATITASDIIDEVGSFSGFDGDFNNVLATTWAQANGQTSQLVLNHSAVTVGNLYYSTKTGSGSVTVGYNAPTGGNKPAYVHSILVLRGGGVASLATLDATARVGGTGYSGTTANMAAITSLTNATITGTSTNAFTYSMNAFTNGGAYLAMGTPTYTAGDGSATATKASPLATMTGYTDVTVASIVRNQWTLGQDTNIVNGDVLHLPTAMGTVNPDTSLTDVVFGTYTMWRREAATGLMYTSQVTVDAPLLSDAFSVSTVTANLTTSITFASAPASISATTAALTTAIPLFSDAFSASTVTADLTGQTAFLSDAFSVSTVTADLTTGILLLSDAFSVSSTTAAITTQLNLFADAYSASIATADITGGSVILTARGQVTNSLTQSITKSITI